MTNKVRYEWAIETLDPEGDPADRDILDVTHFEEHEYGKALERLALSPKPSRLVLVRDEFNDEEGLADRCWAYPTAAGLPERFTYKGEDEEGNGPRVPQRFHRRVAA